MTNYITDNNIEDIEKSYDFEKGNYRLKYLSELKSKSVTYSIIVCTVTIIFCVVLFMIGVLIQSADMSVISIGLCLILLWFIRISNKQRVEESDDNIYLGIVAGFRDEEGYRYALIAYKDGVYWNWQSDVLVDKRFICGDLIRFRVRNNQMYITYDIFDNVYSTFDQNIYTSSVASEINNVVDNELYDGYGFNINDKSYEESMRSYNFRQEHKLKFGNSEQNRTLTIVLTTLFCVPFMFAAFGMFCTGVKSRDTDAMVMGISFILVLITVIALILIAAKASKVKQEKYKEMKRYIGVCHDTWYIKWYIRSSRRGMKSCIRRFMRIRYKNGENWYEQTVEISSDVYSKGDVVEFVLDDKEKRIVIVDTDLSENYTSFDQVLE